MQVLVTEASSPVAYQLLCLLGHGDILQGRKLNLILCDREENREVLEGVRYELQDCVFESLASISISCNFCEVFRQADLAIILPSIPDHHGYSEVEVTHSFLQERDFPCLEGAVHKSVRRKDSVFIHARGPMSKAVAIGNYIKEAYQDSIKVVRIPKVEVPAFPQLSSIQIYGVAGLDLYDELILPKLYPTALNKLQQTLPSSGPTIPTGHSLAISSSEGEQLYERLPSSDHTDQVLLVYALENPVENENSNIQREQKELWSRL